MTVPHFPVFGDSDSFEVVWSGTLYTVTHMEFSDVFLMISLGGMSFWNENRRGELTFLSHYIKCTSLSKRLIVLRLTLITWLT